MTPIANYITIKPDLPPKNMPSGLASKALKNFAHTGTVDKISRDIKQPDLVPGERIIFVNNRGKWIEGECLLHIDLVLATI